MSMQEKVNFVVDERKEGSDSINNGTTKKSTTYNNLIKTFTNLLPILLSCISLIIALASFMYGKTSSVEAGDTSFCLPYCAWYGRQAISSNYSEYIDDNQQHTTILLYAPESITVTCDSPYKLQLTEFENENMTGGKATGNGRKVIVEAGRYFTVSLIVTTEKASREDTSHVFFNCSYSCAKYFTERFWSNSEILTTASEQKVISLSSSKDICDSFVGGYIYVTGELKGMLTPHTFLNRAVSTRVFSFERDIDLQAGASATVWVMLYNSGEYTELTGGEMQIEAGTPFLLGIFSDSEQVPYADSFMDYVSFKYSDSDDDSDIYSFSGYVNLDKKQTKKWYAYAAPEGMPNGNRQGSDVFEGYRIQLYKKDYLSVIDYRANKLLAVVETFDYGHGNACCFSNIFFQENDPMPLLYISDWLTKLVHVTRIYCDIDGTWKADQVGTYTFEDAPYNGYGEFAIDKVNNTLYGIAWSEGNASTVDNHWVFTRWTLPEYGTKVPAVLDESFTFTLPKQNTIQGCCYVNGQMLVLLSLVNPLEDGSRNTRVVVVDTAQRRITGEIRYTDYIDKTECEDIWVEEADYYYYLSIVTGSDRVYKLTTK